MSDRYMPNPNAHITLEPCGKEGCPVCNPIPAGQAADGVGEPKLAKPARVHHTEFAAGLPERLVIECAQRHYEWSREPRAIQSAPEAEVALIERASAALWHSRNFASAKPDIGRTEREHIEGLCNLVAALTAALSLKEAGNG